METKRDREMERKAMVSVKIRNQKSKIQKFFVGLVSRQCPRFAVA